MFKLVVAMLCVHFGDATRKTEVTTWIDRSAFEAGRNEANKLSEITREMLSRSTSQDQTRCVKGQLPRVHEEIDRIVQGGAESIKKEYMIMDEDKFMKLRNDEIVGYIEQRFAGIRPYVEDVLKKIKMCL